MTRTAILICNILLFAVGLSISACEGCGCTATNYLAKLIEANGSIERDFAASVNVWKTAETGAGFVLGDGIRSGEKSQAVLELDEGSRVLMKPKSKIRFLETAPGSKIHSITLEQGELEITVGNGNLGLQTDVGLAQLAKGSKILMARRDDNIVLQVLVGNAELSYGNNETASLSAGDDITISIGNASVVPVEETSEETEEETEELEQDTESDDTEKETPSKDATTMDNAEPDRAVRWNSGLTKNSPAYADFAVQAGDSFVVHAPKPPVSIQFQVRTLCPDGAQVTAKRNIRAQGQTSVNLLLNRGTFRYRVMCVNASGTFDKKAAATGKIIILQDSGHQKLPTKAPVSKVDADGRVYNIYYQNQLPLVIFEWPGAPSASQYTLHVNSRNGDKQLFSVNKPSHKLPNGLLKEGSHKLRFSIADTARRSLTTSVNILFNNAAPKAILKTPMDGGFSRGGTVNVSGIVLPGWSVSTNSGKMELDEEYRFSGTVNHAAAYRSLAVKLVNPKRGVHYYIRSGK